jgi:CheY-like chemotaxis protein
MSGGGDHLGVAPMHVLVVDDDPDIREVARLSLELVAGWRVSVADSGGAAIAIARREQPDVVLLDVMMPGLDGVRTAQLLAAEEPSAHIPVILLTATAPSFDDPSSPVAGVRGVITKPFDPMTLAVEVERVLART